MRLLLCCEFYYPSVGGVAEVMRQIAERMARHGHQVTVATTKLKTAMVDEWNGVRIEHFAVCGNEARGIVGEVERYRDFVVGFPADAILIKAAQQWTFDALFPVLDQIKARKLFIPCGFSSLFEPPFKGYFERLPGILRKFDRLIFYASRYRDIDFCRAHGLTKLCFVPNGASEDEFQTVDAAPGFRARLGIAEHSFVFATVGNLSGIKGHREIAEAFMRLDTGGRHATLVLNGNPCSAPAAQVASTCHQELHRRALRFKDRVVAFVRREGWSRAAWRVWGACGRALWQAWGGFVRSLGKQTPPLSTPPLVQELALLARRASIDPCKQVLITDLPRADVVDLFKTADLFVFASNVEYSPLVLYESAAAATPFLTVPVGNAEEIAELTQGGLICHAPRDKYGYTRVAPDMLARAMAQAMRDPERLKAIGAVGRKNWQEKFTWEKIALLYEALLAGNDVPEPCVAAPAVTVLMPVFNGGVLLEPAVRSILSQSFADFELFVIDDGSTDGAVEALRGIGDPRLRIMGDAARRGTAVRRNQGIDVARGRYIACMDADDIAFPQRLEKQLAYLDAHPDIDLLGSRVVVFRDTDGVVGLHPFAATHEAICAHPWRGFPLPHPTWMGRADWFRRWRYAQPEITRAEDQELLLRGYADSRYACLDEVLIGYRQRAFDLPLTLTARRHLWAAQRRYFAGRGQWGYVALACLSSMAKVAVDCLAALPGCERLFFARMGEEVPADVMRRLESARAAGQGR